MFIRIYSNKSNLNLVNFPPSQVFFFHYSFVLYYVLCIMTFSSPPYLNYWDWNVCEFFSSSLLPNKGINSHSSTILLLNLQTHITVSPPGLSTLFQISPAFSSWNSLSQDQYLCTWQTLLHWTLTKWCPLQQHVLQYLNYYFKKPFCLLLLFL